MLAEPRFRAQLAEVHKKIGLPPLADLPVDSQRSAARALLAAIMSKEDGGS